MTVVFGPLFVAIYAYLYKSPKSRARQVSPRPPASSPGPVGTVTIHDRLVGLQQSFIDANAGFAIPVAVAAIVRIKQQHVPFYELAFLEPLLTMQFLSLLSISLAHAVVGSKGSARSPARVTVMVVCCLAEFALYMGLVGSLRTSETTWAAIQELGSACSSYGAVLPGFEYFEGQLPTDAVPDLPSPFPQFLNTEGWKKGLAIFGLSLAGIAGLAVLAAIVLVLGLLIVEEREPVTVGLLSLGLSIGSLYCAVQMSRKRDAMRIISGGEFQDNEWGFGQVIAIFLWVPLLLHALNLTISEFVHLQDVLTYLVLIHSQRSRDCLLVTIRCKRRVDSLPGSHQLLRRRRKRCQQHTKRTTTSRLSMPKRVSRIVIKTVVLEDS